MASADILRAARAADLPWHVAVDQPNTVRNAGGIGVADTYGNTITAVQRADNAAFIVRACNAHHQMLEALKAALADIEGGGHQSIELINAAIDKAEGR